MRALEIARSALMTQREKIELVSHNIANVGTPGYNCRRAVLAQVPSSRAAGVVAVGLGVEAVQVQRLGDRLLEAQINLETGHLGRHAATAGVLESLESILAGPHGRGLLDPLNDLFDAFSAVAADPSSPTPRQEVIAKAEALCDEVQRMGISLRAALEVNDEQIVKTVHRINELARTVAQQNRIVGEAGGEGRSPDVEDQRGLALAELARLCGAAAIPRDNGYVDVVIGGHFLVQGESAKGLSMAQVAGDPPEHEVSFHGQSPPRRLDGELAGLLEVRSNHLKPARSQLNELVGRLADEMNRRHQAGYDLEDNPGEALFQYDAANPAETLVLNPTIARTPRRIAAASAPGQPANGENALHLEALREDKVLDSGTLSVINKCTDFLASIGIDVQLATSRRDGWQSIVDALEGRYQETAGVALDEEAMRLLEAEKAYEVAQRVIQVVMNLLDETLKLT